MLKGLHEQVQEIKTDVLDIAAQLNLLEEKLLYPSNSQLAIFISLKEEDNFQLDAVNIKVDDEPLVHHIYSFKELQALQKGGVQRIYTGNIKTGAHELEVLVDGQSDSGNEWRHTEKFKIVKTVSPKIVEMSLSNRSIAMREDR
jgi:hypothetical protein